MNVTMKEKVEQANLYLERMAIGKFPISDTMAELNSDLNCTEVVRSLYFIRDVMKELADDRKPQRQNKVSHQFPLECLENYAYEEDKSIMTFTVQLKQLSGNLNVKGLSAKRITDWLKENAYLRDCLNPESREKVTQITDAGEAIGLYLQERMTRFGQKYAVIMYSKQAQAWIIENMSSILGMREKND